MYRQRCGNCRRSIIPAGEELTIEDIAGCLRSTGTVKSRLHKAREKMKEELRLMTDEKGNIKRKFCKYQTRGRTGQRCMHRSRRQTAGEPAAQAGPGKIKMVTGCAAKIVLSCDGVEL